jgi:hypothetical protein
MELLIEGKKRKIAYFIPIQQRTENGWKVGIAAEDLPHYYGTDWTWNCSHEDAEIMVREVNEERGISEEEVKRIVDSSVLASI